MWVTLHQGRQGGSPWCLVTLHVTNLRISSLVPLVSPPPDAIPRPVMLSVLAATLANYAPSVQQQTRMSMSRVTGVSQPIEDVVQQLRGGGGSCDVVLVTKLNYPLHKS